MHRGLPAPRIGIIHDVVVQQREVVKHFDGECSGFGCRDRLLKQVAGHQHECGADTLTARPEGVTDRFIQSRGPGRIRQLGEFPLAHRNQFVQRIHTFVRLYPRRTGVCKVKKNKPFRIISIAGPDFFITFDYLFNKII